MSPAALPEVALGRTGMSISRLGLGAWAIGGGEWQGGWGPQDDDESVATIHRAVELGINWVDTAPAYGLGRAEEVVGRALRELPPADRPYVFTKCGLVWEPGGRTVSNVLAPASIRRECEDSLRRLGVERIDLLQVHWPTEDGTPVEESWAAMAELVDEGKVAHIGVSNFDVGLLDRCQAVRPVETFQPQLNLIVRGAGEATLPWCEAHGTGVIVYSPMRSGLLTGRFDADRVGSLPDDDWRATDPDFTPPRLHAHLALVERMAAVAARLDASVAELAVAWTLAWPAVDGAIVGARRPDQIDGWIRAAQLELGPQHLSDLALALEETGAGHGPTRPAGAQVEGSPV
ncbi:MAG: aldo/keto reductase [Acidimicrobiales bacterium]|nr:aldo/keto reductase [Acidimicrobiales bacterium]